MFSDCMEEILHSEHSLAIIPIITNQNLICTRELGWLSALRHLSMQILSDQEVKVRENHVKTSNIPAAS